MDATIQTRLRQQLTDRGRRLRASLAEVGEAQDLVRLLQEVDAALTRLDTGTYGECRVCGEDIEDDFLLANPAVQYCLCRLSPEQQTFLEKDLTLAGRIQSSLLPAQDLAFAGLQTHYRYLPAGPVSGDYCDLIPSTEGHPGLYFLVGDVSGKGVASSLIMAQLNALGRSLVADGLKVSDLVERTNRLLSDSGLASHYATLVCGRSTAGSRIEVCNAGHCLPLILRHDGVVPVPSGGPPVGMFGETPYSVETFSLHAGETLVLYTDGLTEARDQGGKEYGIDRLTSTLRANSSLPLRSLAAACLRDQQTFLGTAPRTDDVTLLLLRRTSD